MVGAVLNAQGSGAPWNDLRSKNPGGVSITQRFVNPHAFRQGELIAAALEMLPARDVAPMDDALIESLPALRRAVSMAAVARYAAAKALLRIRAIYESQQGFVCRSSWRTSSEQIRLIRSAYSAATLETCSRAPSLHGAVLQPHAPLAMNLPLEHDIAAYLMHSDVYIKNPPAGPGALWNGPLAAAPLGSLPLFSRLLEGQKPGTGAKRPGRRAGNRPAQRHRWQARLARETDLHLIESLCISGRCIQETQDLAYWKLPLRIEVTTKPFGISARVGNTTTSKASRPWNPSFAQFPQGTRFVLYVPGQSANTSAEILRFATDRGLIATTP